jgi:hypothetical protein
MAVVFTAQCNPSASNEFIVRSQAAGVPGGCDLTVTVGLHAGAPTHYSDLSSLHDERLIYSANFTITSDTGGVSFTSTFNEFPLGTIGDQFWVCLFSGGSSGSTAPLAVAGPFIVGR